MPSELMQTEHRPLVSFVVRVYLAAWIIFVVLQFSSASTLVYAGFLREQFIVSGLTELPSSSGPDEWLPLSGIKQRHKLVGALWNSLLVGFPAILWLCLPRSTKSRLLSKSSRPWILIPALPFLAAAVFLASVGFYFILAEEAPSGGRWSGVPLVRSPTAEQERSLPPATSNVSLDSLLTSTIDGEAWELSGEGKVTLLDFWASWCAPCAASVPKLRQIDQYFSEDGRFRIVTVSLDESAEAARRAIERDSIPGIHLHEADRGWRNTVAQHFGVTAIPHTVLVLPEGRVMPVSLSDPGLALEISRLLPPASGH